MTSAVSEIQVEPGPGVGSADVDYARAKVTVAARVASEPVLHVRVRLSRLANPRIEQPALAEVNLDHNGRLVRVQAAAPTMHEAIDRLEARLRGRLERVSRDWEAIRGARPVGLSHEWRRTSPRADAPPYFPRPVDERRLVRRKTFALHRMTPDEAALEMELLDYDFHLYVDAETGDTAVLSRTADGYRLARLRRHGDRAPATRLPLALVHHAAPRLSLDEVIERLDTTSEPFVFYRDVDDGCGHILYRRYDGHYGLISPVS